MITAVHTESKVKTDQIDENGDNLSYRLSVLQTAHNKLDDEISAICDASPIDQLKLVRLKKVKLNLKDQIEKLHSSLYPNIIA